MADKIKSEIVRIDLTDASYKDSHAYIEPTYVNFFFGNNGIWLTSYLYRGKIRFL